MNDLIRLFELALKNLISDKYVYNCEMRVNDKFNLYYDKFNSIPNISIIEGELLNGTEHLRARYIIKDDRFAYMTWKSDSKHVDAGVDITQNEFIKIIKKIKIDQDELIIALQSIIVEEI